jgi:hypothetical protein
MNEREAKVNQLMKYGRALLNTRITSLKPRFPHFNVLTFKNEHWAALFVCEKDFYVDVRYGKGGATHRSEAPFCKPYYMRSGEWVGLDLTADLEALKKAMKACIDAHDDKDDLLILEDDFSSDALTIPARKTLEKPAFRPVTLRDHRSLRENTDKIEKAPKKKSVVHEIKAVLKMQAKGYHIAEVNYAQGLMLSKLEDDFSTLAPLPSHIRAYGDMNVAQVRSYLTLRAAFRKQHYPQLSGPYDLIYAQEILNNIHVDSYEKGLKALEGLEQAYHHEILKEWIEDYKLIYELDASPHQSAKIEGLNVHTHLEHASLIKTLRFLDLIKGHCHYAADSKAYEALLFFVFDKLERDGFYQNFIVTDLAEERPLFRGALYYQDALPLFFFDRKIGDKEYVFNIKTKMLTIKTKTFKDREAMDHFMKMLDEIIDHFFEGTPFDEKDLNSFYLKTAYHIIGLYHTMKIFYNEQLKVYRSQVFIELRKKKTFREQAAFLVSLNLPYGYTFYTGFSRHFYEEMSEEDLYCYLYLRTLHQEKGDEELLKSDFLACYEREVLCAIGFESPEEAFRELLVIARYKLRTYEFHLKFFIIFHHMTAYYPDYFPNEEEEEALLAFMKKDLSDEAFYSYYTKVSSYDFTKTPLYKESPEELKHVLHVVMNALCKRKELDLMNRYFYSFEEKSFRTSRIYLEDFDLSEDDQVYLNALHCFSYNKDYDYWIESKPVFRKRKTRAFFKEIDCVIRKVYHLGRTLKDSIQEPDVIQAIEEVLLEQKKIKIQKEREARKVKINYQSLSSIREDADYITEQVATSEEKAILEDHQVKRETSQKTALKEVGKGIEFNEDEKEILNRLLTHQSIEAYAKAKHLFISVIIDAINEKFDSLLGDVVIVSDGESYALIDDYVEDVKAVLKNDDKKNHEDFTHPLGLTEDERMILNLYRKHQSTKDYIKTHHLLESVVVDAINEKFYEELGDQVIDFDGSDYQFVDDYQEDVAALLGEKNAK